jgi:WhiB family redox-sensing transcriptional regulator
MTQPQPPRFAYHLHRPLLSTDGQREASCDGMNPGFFYPEEYEGFPKRKDYTRGRVICATCPVRTECAEYAIATNEQFGLWGGLPPHERNAIRRKRKGEAVA